MNMRKSLALLLVLIFLVAPCIIATSPAKAQFLGSVYINPDGSVAGTDSIQRDGDVYTLTGNISGGIQIQKSHIVLDGAGYAVEGNGDGRGIDLSNGRGQDPSRPEVGNVTVKNLKIVNFYYGVDNANTNNNTFMGNYIANCVNSYWIIGSSNNIIKYNTLMNATIAINYAGSNHVAKNNFINCWLTVWLSTQPFVDGNYWSAYSTRYPDAKEIGDTGVWDTPYEYWESVADNHPQTKPIDISLYNNPEGEESDPATSTGEPFLTLIVVAVSVAVIALVAIGILAYFKKRKR